MARNITVLLIGGSHMANFVSPGDLQNTVEDPVNGFRRKLKDELIANAVRPYEFRDGGRNGAGFFSHGRTFTGGAGQQDWNNTIAPNVPVDLVVFDGENGFTMTRNLADFFSLAQQNGDEAAQSARQLGAELVHFAGCNAVLFLGQAAPNSYLAAVQEVPNGEGLQNRIGDLVMALPSHVAGMVSGFDMRPTLTPTSAFFPRPVGSLDAAEEGPVWNVAGAAAAAAVVATYIDSIPRYLLQPDQTGA